MDGGWHRVSTEDPFKAISTIQCSLFGMVEEKEVLAEDDLVGVEETFGKIPDLNAKYTQDQDTQHFNASSDSIKTSMALHHHLHLPSNLLVLFNLLSHRHHHLCFTNQPPSSSSDASRYPESGASICISTNQSKISSNLLGISDAP
ncbi:hypothetical protein S83_066138 [Arachis hypogaea]